MRLPGIQSLPMLIPRRACALCSEPHDVLHMTLAGRSWVCRSCLARSPGRAPVAVPEPPPVERIEGERDYLAERQQSVATLRRVEAVVHYGWVAARVAAYIVLAVLSYRSSLWMQFFTGVLVADVMCRVFTVFFEIRLHRFGMALEVALYAALSQAWLGAGGTFSLPDDVEGRAVTMLGFLAVFSMRAAMLVWKLMYGDDRSR